MRRRIWKRNQKEKNDIDLVLNNKSVGAFQNITTFIAPSIMNAEYRIIQYGVQTRGDQKAMP